jgi:hypothetical protein
MPAGSLSDARGLVTELPRCHMRQAQRREGSLGIGSAVCDVPVLSAERGQRT